MFRMFKQPSVVLCRVAFAVGLCLLAATITGRFASLRPDNIESLVDNRGGVLAFPLSKVIAATKSDVIGTENYVRTINEAIAKGVLHHFYQTDKGVDLSVPFTENFILYLGKYIWPGEFRRYEFFDYRRALERGLGNCSQKSIIETEILKEKGIRSHILSLIDEDISGDGHVVVAVEVEPDNWWIADPDFGVVIPHSIDTIETNPQLVAGYYKQAGFDEVIQDDMVSLYDKPGNVLSDRYAGARGYSLKKYYFEKASYVLIWVIPLALMLPLLLVGVNGFERRRQTRIVHKSYAIRSIEP
jgi:hypothetical protein